MVILHISSIKGSKASGISIVVPEHVQNQKKYANVALLNCSPYVPNNEKRNYKVFLKSNYKNFTLDKLDEPFNKPDIVVFHGIYIPEYLKIYKKLLKQNIPYIILPHGSLTKQAQEIKKYKKKIANVIMFDNFIKNANGVQYLSEMEKEYSSKYQVNNFVMGNGIDVPNSLDRNCGEKEKIRMVYIGRIDIYNKGLDLLVNSINLVKDELREYKAILDIYGPLNKEVNTLNNMIYKNGLKDIIKINDGVFGEQKRKILLESDIFIQLSKSEGQPLGIMEAMSYGLPCIVTEGTSFKEIVEKNNCGYGTNSEIKEVANTIKKALLEKQKLKELSKNAYKYAKDNFDFSKIAKKTIEKYEKIGNKNK